MQVSEEALGFGRARRFFAFFRMCFEHQAARSIVGVLRLLLVAALPVLGVNVRAQAPNQAVPPATSASYAQSRSFTYYAAGNSAIVPVGELQTETVEPNNPASCSVSTHGYDAYGNVNLTTLANCSGASGRALFAARTASAAFGGSTNQQITVNGTATTVAVPAGLAPTANQNALGQTEYRQYDPRFGTAIQHTDVATVVDSAVLDDFGRVVKAVHPDGTSTQVSYCIIVAGLDATSNSANCLSPPADAPALAIRYVQQEPHDVSGTKSGPYTRTFMDMLDRQIRVSMESFDGASQPAGFSGTSAVVDSVYDTNGMKVLETQPYFLTSGATHTSTTSTNDVGVAMTVYDELGRVTNTYVADPNADASHARTFGGSGAFGYGSYGTRPAATTGYSYVGLVSTKTNDLGQQRVEEKSPRGDVLRVTDATGAQMAYLPDAFGNVIQTTDALQNSIVTTYDILGRRLQMSDPDKGIILECIDVLGQIKFMQTAVMRTTNPVACSDVAASSTTAPIVATYTSMAYDQLGRMTQRVEPDFTSIWYFDQYANTSATCNRGAGKLCEVQTNTNYDQKIFYDNYGREISNRTDVQSGPSFLSSVSFDATTGRLATKTYPTGLQIGFAYTARGFLQTVNLNTPVTVQPLPNAQGVTAAVQTLTANSMLWQANVVDARGNVESDQVGNGVTDRVTYEAATGRITDVMTGVGMATDVLNHHYVWDTVNNLKNRTDKDSDGIQDANGNTNAVTENFGFDALNRLTQYSVTAPLIPDLNRTVTLQYNALGMLLYKSDLGNYGYGSSGPGAAQPHALLSLSGELQSSTFHADANGNVLTSPGNGKYSAMSYSSFDNVLTATGSGGAQYSWQYGPTHSRMQETRAAGGNTRTTWYLHPDNVGGLAFESETNTSPASQSNRHFIVEGGKTVGVLISTGPLPSVTAVQTAPTAILSPQSMTLSKMEYWHKDHLGSLSATTDHVHGVTARYAYDPFGQRRYTNGAYDATGQILVDWNPALNAGTARGFTGQEEMDDIGLVNLNGRIYDSRLGLFVQADPFVSDPLNLQAFNRYAYVNNNPLNATDPSGFTPISFSGSSTGASGEGSPDAAQLLDEELGAAQSYISGVVEVRGNTISISHQGADGNVSPLWTSGPSQAGTLSAIETVYRKIWKESERLKGYMYQVAGDGVSSPDYEPPSKWNVLQRLKDWLSHKAGQLKADAVEYAHTHDAKVNPNCQTEACLLVQANEGQTPQDAQGIHEYAQHQGEIAEAAANPVVGAWVDAGAGKAIGVVGGMVGGVVAKRFVKDFSTKNTKNWSATFKSEGEARALAREKLGTRPVEVEANKWRSADGKWQYRAKSGDVSDNHIHLEELNPQTGEVLQNLHLRWPEGAGQ